MKVIIQDRLTRGYLLETRSEGICVFRIDLCYLQHTVSFEYEAEVKERPDRQL